ncbi:hypothetical protein BH09PSE5_BH09PSE5_30560 [soil metagenome]
MNARATPNAVDSRRSRSDANAAWRHIVGTARAPYRKAGFFAHQFAQGKLTRDPVFRYLCERGELSGRKHVLDIGCGQALLASLLSACHSAQSTGHWPHAWRVAPSVTTYTGIELMQRDVDRAHAALIDLPGQRRFVCGDVCSTELPPCDAVVILDVLHYVPHAQQDALLTRVRDSLRPGGKLLLRVGDMAARRGFATSQWVDRVVTLVRGHRIAPTFGRTLTEWAALLEALGFTTSTTPMSRGTPFANVLLTGEL